MNIVNIRERAKKMISAGAINKKFLEAFATCPVFVSGSLINFTDEEWEWVTENCLEKGSEGTLPVLTPAKLFIITQEIPSIPKVDWFTDYVVIHPPGFKVRYDNITPVGYDKPDLENAHWLDDVRMTVVRHVPSENGDENWLRADYCGHRKDGVFCSLWRNGETIDVRHRRSKEDFELMASSPRANVLRLCCDTMSHTNTVLRVSPPASKTKSVTWRLAREHYLILRTDQAQKCMRAGRGPSDQEIKRAAHWRRAHFRRLVSERYKQKKGQLVPVRDAWIGPEEWEGTDRKIYRVTHY